MTGTFRKLTTPPESAQLNQIAGQQQQLAGQQQNYGQTLEQPLITGQLPPGGQAQVDLALKNALDTIKGRFSSLGLSGSSMESDAVANAQMQSASNQFTIEEALASLGLTASGQAGGALSGAAGTFNDLASLQVSEDNALTSAISGFAGALGGGALRNPSFFGGGSPAAPGAGTAGDPTAAAVAGEGAAGGGTAVASAAGDATAGIDASYLAALLA